MSIIKHWKSLLGDMVASLSPRLGSCGGCAAAAACAQRVPQVCWGVQSLWGNFSREFSPTEPLEAPNGAALQVMLR